jgi:hypothetical protein
MLLMKAVATAGMLIYAGAGCMSPTIVENTPDVVAFKYGPWETPHELYGRANALCADYDREALMADDYESDLEPNFRIIVFDCVEAPTT